MLQCICCSELQLSVLQCVAVLCSVLQRVAAQCVAVCCVHISILYVNKSIFEKSCSVLQCVAVRCSALQCVAVCRSMFEYDFCASSACTGI